MADDQFSMFLTYLKDSGLYDRSIIVVLSDHGSGWDARGVLLHGSDFEYPWANRVVLAFRGIAQESTPTKISTRVRTIDIAPTILETLKIPVVAPCDGKSLLPLLRGEDLRDRSVFAETGFTFNYAFLEGWEENPLHIRSEIKRFIIDPHTGLVYLREVDYQELIQKKWYLEYLD